uniref:Uncharacterized protein n=1 Tax=Amphimedon queenslandica TaxID=400682 RepID=A0A1X7VS52_AMPQE
MGSSPAETTENVQSTIHQLESLGFIIYWNKIVPRPSETMEFLVLQVDSTSLTLSDTEYKLSKIANECQHFVHKDTVSGRDLAYLLGLLTSVNTAVIPGTLYYRELQRLKHQIISLLGKTNRCHPSYSFPCEWNVTHSDNHWSNENTMLTYLETIIIPYVESVRERLGLDENQSASAIYVHFKANLLRRYPKC